MKLISAGRTMLAAMIRSPSFSRSSSSSMTTMRPWRMSSRIVSIASNCMAYSGSRLPLVQQAFEVAGDQVDLQVDRVSRTESPQRRDLQRVRDQVELEDGSLDTVHRQA